MRHIFVLFILLIFNSMEVYSQLESVKFFGHRGCRGLYPENSLEAFEHAINLNVDGIEWDVVVSKDKDLIISHEPYLDGGYCLNKEGSTISGSEGKKINFYQLSTKEIQEFDCGSKTYSKFPEQKKIRTYKPTVQEAFQKLDLKDKTILFEVKSETKDYGIYQPEPGEFADIIAREIANYEYKENIIFMCFDPKLLEELHKILPDFRYVYLTYKPFTSVKTFLKEISFTPYALGMYYPTIRKRDVKTLHKKAVNIFAWTVNKDSQSNKLIRYGVDGIITDFPDRITFPQGTQK